MFTIKKVPASSLEAVSIVNFWGDHCFCNIFLLRASRSSFFPRRWIQFHILLAISHLRFSLVVHRISVFSFNSVYYVQVGPHFHSHIVIPYTIESSRSGTSIIYFHGFNFWFMSLIYFPKFSAGHPNCNLFSCLVAALALHFVRFKYIGKIENLKLNRE